MLSVVSLANRVPIPRSIHARQRTTVQQDRKMTHFDFCRPQMTGVVHPLPVDAHRLVMPCPGSRPSMNLDGSRKKQKRFCFIPSPMYGCRSNSMKSPTGLLSCFFLAGRLECPKLWNYAQDRRKENSYHLSLFEIHCFFSLLEITNSTVAELQVACRRTQILSSSSAPVLFKKLFNSFTTYHQR